MGNYYRTQYIGLYHIAIPLTIFYVEFIFKLEVIVELLEIISPLFSPADRLA